MYKPPGLHPGDVHVFEATWYKEIEAVVGTGTYGIIFSTKGARSITDEMAGSDLDGDQYWVSWNPEVFLKNHKSSISVEFSGSLGQILICTLLVECSWWIVSILVHLGRLQTSLKKRNRYPDPLSKMSLKGCTLRSSSKLDLIPGTIVSVTLICHAQVLNL